MKRLGMLLMLAVLSIPLLGCDQNSGTGGSNGTDTTGTDTGTGGGTTNGDTGTGGH